MRYHYCCRFLQSLRVTIFTSICLVVGMVGGCNSSPYEYVKVSGKVTFEDDLPIHAKEIKLVFIPQNASTTLGGSKPRYGTAVVNVKDGTFDVVTSHKYGDGISSGTHRVMLIVSGPQSPSDVLPPEYANPEKTPLEVHTDDSPFHLKIKHLAAK